MAGALALLLGGLAFAACGSKTSLGVDGRSADAGAPDTDTGAPPDVGPPPCVPEAAESCNLSDDDCDGTVDEGLGIGPLGEAIVLRSDEFDTGPCSTCSWAWDPIVAPTDDGLLAFWRVGILGGSEMPNVFGRRLDVSANPLGPVELLRGGVTLTMEAMTPSPVGASGLPVKTCFRIGRSDDPGWQLVRSDGSFEDVLTTEVRACGANIRTVWTGERVITAHSTFSGIAPRELHIATARLDGSDEILEVVPVENLLDLRAGAFRGRVGLIGIIVHPEDGQSLDYTRLDARGRVVLGHRPLPEVPYDNRIRLIGTADGWLLVSPGSAFREVPATRQLIDLDGNVLTEPIQWRDGRSFSDSATTDAIFHHPTEPVIVSVWQQPARTGEVSDMHVELWDERGDPIHGWTGPAPGVGVVANPSVLVGDGVLTVSWHDTAGDAEPNSVFVRQFGCVEP